MYSRIIKINESKSLLVLGPRATGKSTWLSDRFPDSIHVDLLDPPTYNELLVKPESLRNRIQPGFKGWITIDEIQRVPELLNVVHSLIEQRRLRFALTGSSARKLRTGGVNLLAGRALTYSMYPLTAEELGKDFDLVRSLRYGQLPSIPSEQQPEKYLASYVQTYLREEIQQEGLTRNLAAFSRFLAAASFSQGNVLNISEIARESENERKTVEGYFSVVEDLLIGIRIPIFSKRAKRNIIAHPKFYFFDAGVYRAIRPKGPLDESDVIPGAAFETLIMQEIRALNDYYELGYEIFYWRTTAGVEVDFILYGKKGIIAIECKSSTKIHPSDFNGLKAFKHDYPSTKCLLIYGGENELNVDSIPALPASTTLPKLIDWLK